MEEEEKKTNEVNTDFMKEKIKQRPVNRKKLLRRTAITAFLAAMFGAVACIVFLLLEPVINRAINPPEMPEAVTFPEEEQEMSPEQMMKNEKELTQEQVQQQISEEVSQQVDKDQIKQEVISDIERSRGTAKELENQYSTLGEIAEKAAASVVTVTAITKDYDWAGDMFNNTGSSSGLVLAKTGTEILILAQGSKLPDAGSLEVTTEDHERYDAKVKACDLVTGLTVLGISESGLSEEEKEKFHPAVLGSSSKSSLLGKPVIAVGSPAGTAGSVSYGIVTTAALPLDLQDSSLLQITTDIYGSTGASGVLADLSGNIIGWIDMSGSRSDTPNLVCAVGVTELKPVIEAMSNGRQQIYLGIHGAAVPEDIAKAQSIPEGAFVTKVEMDSPAMAAGIQSGDVITSLGERKIENFEDLTLALKEIDKPEPLQVSLQRQGVNGYETVQVQAAPKARFLQ